MPQQPGADDMLKKIPLVLSVLAALGFAIATSASAAPQHRGGSSASRSVHVNTVRTNRSVNVRTNRSVNVRTNRSVGVNRAVRGNYVVGRRYNGHIWYGRSRHFWHGRWYGYGDGPCWINVDGLWFWNELACPL
jgi:hypothetical protein